MANREKDEKNQAVRGSHDGRATLLNLAIIFVIASFIAFLRPFGMAGVEFWRSWGYWLTMCYTGTALYSPLLYLGRRLAERYFDGREIVTWGAVVVFTILASVLMALVVPLGATLFFPVTVDYWSFARQALIPCLGIGGFITFIVSLREYSRRQLLHMQSLAASSQDVQNTASAQALMEKLPLEKRGQLRCLQMEDHYLRVYTSKGEHLVLMRFKDALSLLEGYPGLKTHRSWWVAHDAISGSRRDGRKLLLNVEGGIEVPVSKTYVDGVKSLLSGLQLAA